MGRNRRGGCKLFEKGNSEGLERDWVLEGFGRVVGLRVSNGVIFGRTAQGWRVRDWRYGDGWLSRNRRGWAVGGSLGRWIFGKERAWLGKSCCWWRDTEAGSLSVGTISCWT